MFDQHIGKGGNGTVYKGYNRNSMERVAMKLVNTIDESVAEVSRLLCTCYANVK